MNVNRFFFLCCLFCFITTENVQGKEWKEINPLHSNRAEVEKKLGPPVGPSSEYAVGYKTQTESVFVLYARGGPCGTDATAVWRVPRDTVISLTVSPNHRMLLSDLHLDENKYKKTDNEGHGPPYFYYTNEEDGVQYEVINGLVTSIVYFPSAKDQHLRCCNNSTSP